MTTRVDYQRTGGIAGIALTAAADESDLAPEHVRSARRLLESGRATATAPLSDSSSGADGFSYRLTVVDGDRAASFEWPEPDVPDDVRPLLDDLRRRAVPSPPPH